ncbi:MAG: lolB [Burkholderiaceae bacterium]|nr:lolB [Burkholderiaceae bacterium]
MKLHLQRSLLILFTLYSLAACTTLKPIERTESSTFNMDARMAIQFQETDSDKNSSGKLRWEEYPSSTDITLSTPFGNTIALIHITPTQASYKGSDGSVVIEDTADELFYRLFGMDLPIANLRDWIGTPNQPLTKVRDENGWHVVVTDTFANPNLARGLEVSRTSPKALSLYVSIENRSDNVAANTEPAANEVNLDDLLPKPKPAQP